MVESGNSVSLKNVTTVTSLDVRFPAEVHVVVEKLYSWSVVINIYFGANHCIAQSVCKEETMMQMMLELAGLACCIG